MVGTRMASRSATVFIVLILTATAYTRNWKQFISSAHFSVMYPSAWSRVGSSGDRLRILSSSGGAEGIIIKRGQGEILVMEAQTPLSATMPQIIKYYTTGTVVLSRRDIHSGTIVGRGCSDLEEVVSKEEAVPAGDIPIAVPHIINTDFFCKIDGRTVVTLLRNWQGDHDQGRYQRTALQMAKSIRSSP